MTALAKLEKAVNELTAQATKLVKKIKRSTWKEHRRQESQDGGGDCTDIGPAIVASDEEEVEGAEPVGFVSSDYEEEVERRLLSPDTYRVYQQWYSGARVVIAKNQSARLREFDGLDRNVMDLIRGRHMSKSEVFAVTDCVYQQTAILGAVLAHIRYSVYDIELAAYSVLMDDEMNAARSLLSEGWLRPPGVLARVALERHLKNLLRKHTPPIKFKDKATLAHLNDSCKDAVYDLLTWRKVQLLTDLTNLCCHHKDREPKKSDVEELIQEVSAMIKSHSPGA